MKSFKTIREGNSVEPGVSEIDDVQDDPLSFVEIKPKKSKVVKEDLQEAVSVKKEKHSWGTMMTVHHGSDTSYPLHPEHQSAIKKLRPGMKTTFKDETNSTVHAHREGDTVHLTRPKTGSTLTSLPYHHFDTSEHAKPAAKKPAGEYDRKVTDHLKKKYNEEAELGEANIQPTAAKSRSHIGNLSHPTTNHVAHPSSGKEIGLITKQPDGKYHAHPSSVKLSHSQGGTFDTKDQAHQHIRDAHAKAIKTGTLSDRWKKQDKLPQFTKEETVLETKGAPKGFHFTKDGKLKRGDANQDGDGGPMLRSDPLDKQRNKVPAVSEGVDFLKIWNGIKPVHEEVKTTHEDPLVVTKDAEGHIHTHANLSVANAIHGTDVKHQAIHTGKPVQGGKFTFELSKHHEGALKEDAPFDPVAHKKELDKLMGKHMAAHTETSKLISAKAPQEQINKAQERNNAVKAEIRAHKDKVPKGPAPKPGSAADYYASKKPGEYTGD